jgi:hypothetical protein
MATGFMIVQDKPPLLQIRGNYTTVLLLPA